MAEALSIDMDEMMAILAATEPEHSHATDDMTIELNVVFNIMTDVERSDVSVGCVCLCVCVCMCVGRGSLGRSTPEAGSRN